MIPSSLGQVSCHVASAGLLMLGAGACAIGRGIGRCRLLCQCGRSVLLVWCGAPRGRLGRHGMRARGAQGCSPWPPAARLQYRSSARSIKAISSVMLLSLLQAACGRASPFKMTLW
jgi:hypothetical protein